MRSHNKHAIKVSIWNILSFIYELSETKFNAKFYFTRIFIPFLVPFKIKSQYFLFSELLKDTRNFTLAYRIIYIYVFKFLLYVRQIHITGCWINKRKKWFWLKINLCFETAKMANLMKYMQKKLNITLFSFFVLIFKLLFYIFYKYIIYKSKMMLCIWWASQSYLLHSFH